MANTTDIINVDCDIDFQTPLLHGDRMEVTDEKPTATSIGLYESNKGQIVSNERNDYVQDDGVPSFDDSFAPVAPFFHFFNHVPTRYGHSLEFNGAKNDNVSRRSLYRVRDQKSRNRKFRKWVENIQVFGSSKESNDSAERKNESLSSIINFTMPNWRSRPSFIAFDWSKIQLSSISRLICTKEWEEDFLQRNGVVNDSGSTTWWDGRSTVYSIAKDSLCSKTMIGLDDQLSATTLSTQSEYQISSPYASSSYQFSNFDGPSTPSYINNADQSETHEAKGFFNLCQTSLFYDTLRIKVDMGSQFAFAVVFIWLMHYAYLCIVVYVLRDNSNATSRPSHRGRQDFADTTGMDDPRLEYELTFTSSYDSLHKRRIAADHLSGHDDETQDLEPVPYTRNERSGQVGKFVEAETINFEAKSDRSLGGSIENEHDHEISSEESKARAEMGLPKYIIIQQPSYLTTLCMLESDTDDDDSVLSSIDENFHVSS